MMSRAKKITLALAISFLLALLSHSTLPPAALAQGPDDNCPLSEEQAQNSVDAWDKIAQVFTGQPRCFNCHGGVDPFAEDAKDKHGGGQLVTIMKTVPDPDTGEPHEVPDGEANFGQCKECHRDFPGVWRLPQVSFVGVDALTLCTTMKSLMSAESFIAHIEHDADPTSPFIQEAFTGRMGLPPLLAKDLAKKYPDPPVGVTHQDLIQMAHAWVDAQGGKFQGDDSCGCTPIPSWYGTIKGQAQWNIYNDSLSINFVFTIGANGVVKGKGHAKMTNAQAINAGCLVTIKRAPDELDVAISGRRDGDWFNLKIEDPPVASTYNSVCPGAGRSGTLQSAFFGIMSTGPNFKAPRVLAKDGATNSLDFQMPGRLITGTIEIHQNKKNGQ